MAVHDLGDEGASQADRVVVHDELFIDGKSVGELGVDCTDVDLDGQTGFTSHCVATESLPGGQIAGQGPINSSRTRCSASPSP